MKIEFLIFLSESLFLRSLASEHSENFSNWDFDSFEVLRINSEMVHFSQSGSGFDTWTKQDQNTKSNFSANGLEINLESPEDNGLEEFRSVYRDFKPFSSENRTLTLNVQMKFTECQGGAVFQVRLSDSNEFFNDTMRHFVFASLWTTLDKTISSLFMFHFATREETNKTKIAKFNGTDIELSQILVLMPNNTYSFSNNHILSSPNPMNGSLYNMTGIGSPEHILLSLSKNLTNSTTFYKKTDISRVTLTFASTHCKVLVQNLTVTSH
jgi:hypothetical protein